MYVRECYPKTAGCNIKMDGSNVIAKKKKKNVIANDYSNALPASTVPSLLCSKW